MIKLTFQIKAISKDNCKIVSKSGHQFLPQKYKDWEQAVGLMAKSQYRELPLEGKLEVSCIFYFKDKIRRDVGNYQKSVLDSLKGICYKDDSQIYSLHLYKDTDTKIEAMTVIIHEIEKGD